MINIRNKKILKMIIAFNIIFLTVIIFFTPFIINVYNLNTYRHLYEKNNVFDNLPEADVLAITRNLFDFFRHRDEIRELDFEGDFDHFEENEIEHLKDVRVLFDYVFIIYFTSLAFFTGLSILFIGKGIIGFLKYFGYILLGGAISVITVLLLLYFLSQNFGGLFENFHLIFFPQGNYMFLESTLIITLFPFGFFYGFFMLLIYQSIIIAASTLAASIMMLLISRFMIKRGGQ
jgi:hypothetical protein